ncbi:MAG: bifunctional glutamate N-acetyltransferase/amino-acid acetyltransferase ArgJ [Lentisphaeraceae bacterium]|nr:bifunctional glutamate N-acetyltransferase/amino-acid acetyltransferase ArgJ [Lentisphaeraceae bacterium]
MFHEKAIMPKGYTCASINCGLKKDGAEDLSVIYSEKTASAAAVFTKNQVPGAPVIVGREIIAKGKLQALVINSKVSNVGTGEQGVQNARRMGAAVAKEFGCSADEVLMSSTGVIAVQLPIEKVEAGVVGIKDKMNNDPLVAAKGIMTTDTHPKAYSVNVGDAVITLIAKGSGMIEPNMATMLAYCLTDADIEPQVLDQMLRKAVNKSFNMLSIDTDTSTSDTVVIMANGLAGKVDESAFQEALDQLSIKMTETMARDGEGATKLIRTEITGAVNYDEARVYAKSMINSPLIKTMAFGADPNIGRILMALGKCFENTFDLDKLTLSINDTLIYKDAGKVDYDEPELRKTISGDPVVFQIDLGLGDGSATTYGCDLTHGYVDENAAYYSS